MEITHTKKKVDGRIKYEKVCSFCGEEVSYFHGNKPSKCPHCGAENYIRPPTETKLFLLQEQYLANRDEESLSKMFVILKRYAKSMIKKLLPKNFTYHYGKIDEKAEDAVTLLIENYLESNDFRIEQSFGGYLQWKVKEVLWNKKLQREENHFSLQQSVFTDIDSASSTNEIIDMMTNEHEIQPLYGTIDDHTQDFEVHKDDVVEGIDTIIDRILQELRPYYSFSTLLLVLIGICLRIEGKSSLYMSNFYSHFGSHLQDDIDMAMLMIYRFIKEEE